MRRIDTWCDALCGCAVIGSGFSPGDDLLDAFSGDDRLYRLWLIYVIFLEYYGVGIF